MESGVWESGVEESGVWSRESRSRESGVAAAGAVRSAALGGSRESGSRELLLQVSFAARRLLTKSMVYENIEGSQHGGFEGFFVHARRCEAEMGEQVFGGHISR